MLSDDGTISCAFEADALGPDDERPEAAARAFDDTWPYPLAYEVGDESEGAALISHEHDRERWLRSAIADGDIPLLTTADRYSGIFFSGHRSSGEVSPYDRAIIRALLEFPATDEFVAKTPLATARVGHALRAFWGMATPEPARTILTKQRVHPGQNRVPPLGLPVLPGGIKLASSAVPRELGWVNYWSPPAVALLQFPDPARDGEWLRHATALDDGAWVVQLTADPLDLDRTDHLDAVKRAYDRFAEIGRYAAAPKPPRD